MSSLLIEKNPSLEENSSSPESTFLSEIELKIKSLTENLEGLENDAIRMTQADYNNVKTKYTDTIKQIELELNKGIINFGGKTRISIIRFQKALGVEKKKFEGILYMKKRFIDEEQANSKDTVDSTEKEEEESFGLLNGTQVKSYESFVANKSKKDDQVRKDMELMQEIIKDMKDISEKGLSNTEFVAFDIEKVEDALLRESSPKRNSQMKTTNSNQYYKIALMLAFSIALTLFLVWK